VGILMPDSNEPEAKGSDNVSLAVAIAVIAAFIFVIGIFSTPHPPDPFDIAVKASELMVWIAGLWSIVILRGQLQAQRQAARDEFHWKTLVTYHQLFEHVPDKLSAQAMYSMAKIMGVADVFKGAGEPLPNAAVEAVMDDSERLNTVRAYLDGFERFCAAVACGLVNSDYAYSIQGGRVIRNFVVFEGLIKKFQHDNKLAYIELQKTATKWKSKRQADDEGHMNDVGVGARTVPKYRRPIV